MSPTLPLGPSTRSLRAVGLTISKTTHVCLALIDSIELAINAPAQLLLDPQRSSSCILRPVSTGEPAGWQSLLSMSLSSICTISTAVHMPALRYAVSFSRILVTLSDQSSSLGADDDLGPY